MKASKEMQTIANEIFSSFENKIHKLKYVSNYHEYEKEELIDLYNKIERIKNRIITPYEHDKQVTIFSLCKMGLGMYETLIKWGIPTLAYWEQSEIKLED